MTITAGLPVDQSFLARVYEAGARFGDRVALQVPGHAGMISTTYRQLLVEVGRLGAELDRLGIRRGQRVVLVLENHPRWCVCFLAILHRRAVAVPLDVHYSDRELVSVIKDSGAVAALASPDIAARLQTLRSELPDLRHVLPIETAGWRPSADGPDLAPHWGAREDLVSLMYTSGTTGDPKGVMLTNGNVLAQLDALIGTVPVDETDIILSLLPLSHILAQLTNLLFPLVVGARTVFVSELTTTGISRALKEGQVTVFGGVPQLFYLFHQRILGEVARRGSLARAVFARLGRMNGVLRNRTAVNLGRRLFSKVHEAFGGRIKLFYSGGSYLDPDVTRDFHRWGFEFLQGFGMTETCGVVTLTPSDDNRIGSVGRPIRGIEVRIANPDEQGIGEVLIRGAAVMAGYFNKPERTAQVLRDGWLHSGDLGRLDPDGHLTLTGRAKEIIVLANGENIHPEELERHYEQSPFVKEICVLGVEKAGGRAGEEVLHAVIVPDFDSLRAKGIASASEAIRFDVENLSAALTPFKRVLSFELRSDPLPRTTTRKIKRHEVKRSVGTAREKSGPAAAPAPTPEQEQLLASREGEALVQALRSAGRVGGVVPSSHLELDLGLDSLSRVELLAGVEEQLGVSLDDETSSSLSTVADVIQALQAASPASGHREGPGRGASWPGILSAARADATLADYFDTGLFNSALHYVVLKGIYLSGRLLLRLEVRGLEHLPRSGPYLICPNHQSYIDGALVSAALPFQTTRNLFYLGEAIYFGDGVGRHFGRIARIVPVNPDRNLLHAMRIAAAALGAGKILTVYPEGERSIDGRLGTFKKGAAILARELRAPLVPVAIAGAHHVWGRASNRIRLGKVSVRFGPPIDAARYSDVDPEVAYAALNEELREGVAKLLASPDRDAVTVAA